MVWTVLESSASPRPPVLQELAWSPPVRHARVALKHALRGTYTTRRPLVTVRQELPELLNRRGLLGCGAEIGVKGGEFSDWLLEHWRGLHLVSIDPWSEAPSEEYVDVANVAQQEHDRFFAETTARLQRYGDRSTIWRNTGEEAAQRVLHHSLDFVYLDARHDYESVLSDLDNWYDKVRPGGVIAGHDYVDGHFGAGMFGVRSAVDDFFSARNLAVHKTVFDRPWLSWYVLVEKPARA